MSNYIQEPISFHDFSNVIDGKLRDAEEKYHGIDPTNKLPNWEAPVATMQDVEDTVAAANRAFESWKHVPWDERAKYLWLFSSYLEIYKEDMIKLLVRECGKPLVMARGEVETCFKFIDWHANLPEPKGNAYETEYHSVVHKFIPIGVVAAICPWNFPIILCLGKILPAILMGNAIIVKPSPFTPYTSLKLVEIANLVFPPGLVQAIGGGDTLGPALVDHSDIHKISFTGSTATGKRVMAAAAKTVKRVTLEMGGNDAAIVLPDADVSKAAILVAQGAFHNTSQVCIASKRVYVHSSIYESFLANFINAVSSLKVGSPHAGEVDLGPIQNEMQYNTVKGFFKNAEDSGHQFVLGHPHVASSDGFFVHPAIIRNPPDDSLVVTKEAFGPIVPVLKYNEIEEVISRANSGKEGLGASVFGTDVKLLQEVADRLDVGCVWINTPPAVTPGTQLGGFKESGLGTEFGTLGIFAYANVKAITCSKN